jgi:rhodanese-related sulfurtransferase
MVELNETAADLVEAVGSDTEALDVTDAAAEHGRPNTVFVDVRDVRELWRDGTIPNAGHVPRGMLEFWADPESAYHREFLTPSKRVVTFCSASARATLAAGRLEELGYPDVAHLDGGLEAWAGAGKTVETVESQW